jgi:branched-chain amino acid transport system substrate-binding protein
MGFYGTGFNVAGAPTYAKLSYPLIAQACLTDLGSALAKKYSQAFFFNGSVTQYCQNTIDILRKLRDEGKIGNRVAMISIADEFGIELSNLSSKSFPQAGFEIVYAKSYPMMTQDYAPTMKAVIATNPDIFVAWSYPADTFGLAEQAKIESLSTKAYYCAVGCAFRGFYAKYRAAAENILGTAA